MANIVSLLAKKASGKIDDAVETASSYTKAAKKKAASLSGEPLDIESVKNSGYNVLKYDEEGVSVGLNKKGKGLLALSTVLAGVSSGIDQRYINDIGSYNGRITQPTPDYSEYVHMKTPSASYRSAPAGADGSLVFALDRCKNGGYL